MDDPNTNKFFSHNFNCDFCSAIFYDEISLNRHLNNIHKDKFIHKCSSCSYETNSMVKYSQHCQKEHNRCFIEPVSKRQKIDDEETINTALPIRNNDINEIPEENQIVDVNNKKKNIYKTIYRKNTWNYKGVDDVHTAMNNMREKIKLALSNFINEDRNIPTVKFQITIEIEFAKLIDLRTDEWTISTAYFNSNIQNLLDMEVNFSYLYDSSVNQIWRNIDRYIRNGSGWVFRRIQQIKLNSYRYQPFAGSSYIPTPRFIANKKCVMNIINKDDNQCFKWCILAYKYKNKVNKNSNLRSTIYKRQAWINSINWTGIQFPTSLLDIDVFERNNKDWAINVIQVNTSVKRTIPTVVRKSDVFYTRKNQVTLLLLVDDKTGNQHYTLCTDYNRILKTNFNNKSKLCWNCMATFSIRSTKEGKIKDENRYTDHVLNCIKNKPVKITFPKNKIMKFRNVGFMRRNEFNITADFECLMGKPPITDDNINEEEYAVDTDDADGISILSTHKVFSVALHVVSDRFQNQFTPQKYREGIDGHENAGYMFCKMLYENIKKINNLYETECNKPMYPLTAEEEQQFNEGTICHICEEEIKCKLSYKKWMSLSKICTDDPSQKDKLYVDELTLKGPKVKDHNHWTGFYRGIAHAFCNSQFKERGNSVNTSVFLHNGARYDNHIILQNLFKFLEDNEDSFKSPSVIAKTMEQFIQIKLGKNSVIKDSLNFLGGSLDGLVKNLKDEGKKTGKMKELFKHSYSFFDELRTNNSDLKDDDFDLLTRKNVYPYEYMTDLSKCNDQSLPPIEEFYSHLTNTSISIDDYNHGLKVFETFKCKDLGEYTDLYVLTDTLLLSDVLENFRKQTYDKFKLDPVYYTSTPAMTLDCALKYTKSEFEIFDDVDKALFADKAITGGYSAAHIPHAIANNKLIEESYDPEKKDSYIIYLDANNLYGCGLRDLLPYKGLKFLSSKDIEPFNNEEFIKNLSDTAEEGYFIQCDIEYPKELHNNLAHISLPLLPEHLDIDESMLSDFQRKTADNLDSKIGGEKVVTSFFDKKDIILHYRNLKQCLKYGLKLKKVSAVMEFQQAYVFRTYVDLCTKLRKESNNAFEKAFYKMLINSLFGKTCENMRKRREVKLVATVKDFLKYTKKPFFERGVVYDDERFAGIEMKKESICLNKPRYVGAAVLNLSKIIMYDFHYDFMMKEFPECELLFTDTDSLCYHIRSSENIYDVLKRSKYMDFSNFSQSSDYYDDSMFLVPGKFKDECGGFPIKECIALRSKMYSVEILRVDDDGVHEKDNKKVAKGITRAFQKNYINHNDYIACLESNVVKKCLQTNIRSHDHKLYTTNYIKNGLSAWNDKRIIYRDDISKKFYTLPLGHYLSMSGLSDEEIIKSIKNIYPSDEIIKKRGREVEEEEEKLPPKRIKQELQ